MRLDRTRADAGAATAMRDAEGLVQVQMRNIRAPLAGPGQADQGVEVGAIGVDLAAMLVHGFADGDDILLEHAVRGRISDHQCGETIRILLRLFTNVIDIDVAILVAARDHHGHAGHLRRGGIGAVRGFRNQAHIAVTFAARAVIGANGKQAGEFALRTGIRLQADRVVAGDLDQHRFKLVDELLVTKGLIGRCQRMDVGEFGPGHRDHLGGGVEFHRARAERDHRPIHGQVLVGQRAHVAQQFVLAVVRVEHRMLHERRLAQQLAGQGIGRFTIERVDGRYRRPASRVTRTSLCIVAKVNAEYGCEGNDVGTRGRLVNAQGDAARIHRAQVDARRACPCMHGGGIDVADMQGVEEIRGDAQASLAQRAGEDRRHAMRAQGDALESIRAVIDRVHAGHDRQQHLRRANVRGRLFATDMLLAGLQGQPIGRFALGVDRHSDQATGHRALVGIAATHEGGMRAAKAEWHAKALAVADDDIGTPFARRADQGQGKQVGGDRDQGAARVRGFGECGVVVDPAKRVRVLQQHAETVDARRFGVIANVQFDVEAVGARVQHFEGLRVHRVGDKEDV